VRLTGVGFLALAALAATACGPDDPSRPGSPRTARTPLEGAPFPYAESAEEVGLSPDALWLFKERLYSRVVARHVVGAEILVLVDGGVVLHQAMGWADRDDLVPMERNSIFRLASMTKPLAGTATLMLVDEGLLRTVADLYDLQNEWERLCALKFSRKLGAKETDNLLASIEQSKTRPLARLLCALNIRHVGASNAESLAEHFGEMDKISEADEEQLGEVEGIGPELTKAIVTFFASKEGARVVKRLEDAGVNMRQPRRRARADSPLIGKTVVVTGKFTGMSRNELHALIKQLGGKPATSVSQNTDMVICGDSPGSKLDKAKKLGVMVLSEADFRSLIGR